MIATSRPPLLAIVLLAVVSCDRGGQSSGDRSPTLRFENVTASSGIDFTTTSGRTPSTSVLEVKGGGLALVDFDQDGDRDLFVPNGATLDSPTKGPGCRFFENVAGKPGGGIRFQEATAKSGLAFDRWGFGPCVFDYDGDGKDDVYVACFGRNVLVRNTGGRFEDVTEKAGVAGGDEWSTAAACGDIDQDGDLDLYVVNYLEFDPKNPPASSVFLTVPVFGGPKGLPGQADRCFVNQGDGRFEDATSRLGFDKVEPGYGLGAIILDFDLDGRQDIFVGNDSGRNNLFVRGDDGTFADAGGTSGLATNGDGLEQATMGIAIGDVNGDLLPDVFTTNFMNDTNTLQVNLGLGKRLFSDQTALYGVGIVSRPHLKWATQFVDFDLDADEDLVVFHGHVYPSEITEPHGWGHDQTPQLFRREAKRFELATPEQAGPWLAEKHCDRSAVFDDLDQDGDVDVIVNGLNQPIRVLENTGGGGRWAIVELNDSRPAVKNRRGVGSRVVLEAGGRKQVRWIHPGGSYQAANPCHAHFGLPAGASEYRLEITWPDGFVQRSGPHAANARVVVARPLL